MDLDNNNRISVRGDALTEYPFIEEACLERRGNNIPLSNQESILYELANIPCVDPEGVGGLDPYWKGFLKKLAFGPPLEKLDPSPPGKCLTPSETLGN